MTIEKSSDNQFDLDSIKTLSDFKSELSEFKAIIGDHGGRRFVYQGNGKSYCLNDLYKKLDTLFRETLSKNQGCLSHDDEHNIEDAQNKLWVLNFNADLSLKNEKITKYQRVSTRIRQLFGNLFYNRTKTKDRIDNSVKQTWEYFTNFIKSFLQQVRPVGLYDGLSEQDLKQWIQTSEIDKNNPKQREGLRRLAEYLISKGKSYFVLSNLESFAIDPSSLSDIIKELYDHPPDQYRFPGYYDHKLPNVINHLYIHERQAPLETFFNALKYSGYTIPKEIIFKLIENHGSQMSKENLTKYIKYIGLDVLQEDQLQICIKFLKLYKGEPPISLDAANLQSITGLRSNTLQEWKILTTIIKEVSKEGEADKNVWEFIKAKKISGLTQKEKEYLYWLTDKELLSFNLPFVRNHDDLSMLPPEQLRVLFSTFTSESLVNVLLSYPKKMTAGLAWITLLERNRSNLKRDNLNDLTGILSPSSIIHQIQMYGSNENTKLRTLDLTGVIFASEDEHNELKEILIKVLQSCPHLVELRLPADILIDDDIIAALPETLQKLTLENGTVSSSCLKNLPPATGTLILDNVQFSAYPAEVSPNLQILQCNGNTSFSKDKMIHLPDTLEEFYFGKWERKFIELRLFLPPNLKKLSCQLSEDFTQEVSDAIPSNLEIFDLRLIRLKKETIVKIPPYIKKIRISPTNSWNGNFNELTPYLHSELEELFYCCESLEQDHVNLESLPEKLKTFSLFTNSSINMQMFENKTAPANIINISIFDWSDSFQNLLPLLPKNIEKLTVSFGNDHMFSDADILDLPKSLKTLNIMGYKGDKLTEVGKKQLMDKGINLVLT